MIKKNPLTFTDILAIEQILPTLKPVGLELTDLRDTTIGRPTDFPNFPQGVSGGTAKVESQINHAKHLWIEQHPGPGGQPDNNVAGTAQFRVIKLQSGAVQSDWLNPEQLEDFSAGKINSSAKDPAPPAPGPAIGHVPTPLHKDAFKQSVHDRVNSVNANVNGLIDGFSKGVAPSKADLEGIVNQLNDIIVSVH